MTDEIRCHVSLSPMFLGETLLGPMVTVAPVTSGPFYCPLVQVVNRSPLLSGHQERTEAAPVQKSNCWLRGSPAQKGRCANPCRRCRVPELPGELNNIEESWPRSSSVFPDPFPCCSATTERSRISAGHYSRAPLKIKRGYGRKNGAGVSL